LFVVFSGSGRFDDLSLHLASPGVRGRPAHQVTSTAAFSAACVEQQKNRGLAPSVKHTGIPASIGWTATRLGACACLSLALMRCHRWLSLRLDANELDLENEGLTRQRMVGIHGGGFAVQGGDPDRDNLVARETAEPIADANVFWQRAPAYPIDTLRQARSESLFRRHRDGLYLPRPHAEHRQPQPLDYLFAVNVKPKRLTAFGCTERSSIG